MNVYGKGADFDTGSIPIVRVDARRLRDKPASTMPSHPTTPSSFPFRREATRRRSITNGSATATAIDLRSSGGRCPPHTCGRSGRNSGVRRCVCRSLSRSAGGGAERHRTPLRLLTVTSFPGRKGCRASSARRHFVVFTWRASIEGRCRCVGESGRWRRHSGGSPIPHSFTRRCQPGRQGRADCLLYRVPRQFRSAGVFWCRRMAGPEMKDRRSGWCPLVDAGWSIARNDRRNGDEQSIFLQVLDDRRTQTVDASSRRLL
jgi:hypothetical protein